ncbi:hypothetical protein EVAR_15002_1 [Eumeta japonica]|uniref:Uncharacterized protein n=1 Tax=Eumeta variegata TaxID=151549 RepID=A0A4C1X5G8_EUMVA|nr:hypothetical protein EVAR_15002_1 [Eumeta japonica]
MQIFLPSSPSLWLAFYRTFYADLLPSSSPSLYWRSTTVRSMQIFLPSSPSLCIGVLPPYALCRSFCHHHHLYDWRSTTVRSMQIFLPSSPSLWLAFYHRTLYADLSAIITIFMAGVLPPYALCRSFCHHHHLYGWRSTTVRSMQIFLPSSPSL